MSGSILPLGGLPLGGDTPWLGGLVTARAICLLAPNPSPMTLDGTNTWILAEPDSGSVFVVDPGPDDLDHLGSIVAATAGRRVAQILLTHGHSDHSDGARRLADLTGAPVAALDPMYRYGSEGLQGGMILDVDGLVVEIIATPGHTADSLSFHLVADGAVLTGDTVLGRGSTLVVPPDGRLGDYLESLVRIGALIESTGSSWILPGHGPALADPLAAVAGYLAHRHSRLEQVRGALRAGAVTADEIVAMVYADTPLQLWPAARMSVTAQLDYLHETN